MSSDKVEGMEEGMGEEVTLSDSMVQSPPKQSAVKRVTMSGVDSDDTVALTEDPGEVNPAPPSNSNENPAVEEAPVMENTSTAQANTTLPKRLTKIERLMEKLERRRQDRMEVSFLARGKFIDLCLEKVKADGASNEGERVHGISMDDLRLMRDEHKYDGEVGAIFEYAVKVGEEADSEVFFFRDFNEYYLMLRDTYFRRNPTMGAIVGVLAYYVISLILFCGILQNNSTCPRTDGGPSYEGWLTAIYFASVTISTVGYGDVSVIGSGLEVWRVLIGTLYMIFAMVIAVTVFSSLSDKVLEISNNAVARRMQRFFGSYQTLKKDEPLRDQLRRMWIFKIVELSLFFLLINLLGMVVAMLIMGNTDDGDAMDWSWMTGFYWAVQTTTTIGYGDLDMAFDLRWFNFLFAIIGTTFAASILGSLADLRSNLRNRRRLYVWKNREVSMQLIADMEADGDNQLDEYEFLIGSLVTLEKLNREDVEEIMSKFRELAGEDQVINQEDIEKRQIKLHISKDDIERYNSNQREGDRNSYRKDYWENVEQRS